MADIDHLLYASHSLAQGIDEVEQLFGVRPVVGGQHPNMGTHNALMALGPSTYLEVIARDPALQVPTRGALVDFAEDETSRLITWAVRTSEINTLTDKMHKAGVSVGKVDAGRRETPEGQILAWRFTDPYAMPMGGAVPFLIDWGNTPHPASSIPSGGNLRRLRIAHPQAAMLGQLFSTIGVEVEVVEESAFRLTALIESQRGVITLE